LHAGKTVDDIDFLVNGGLLAIFLIVLILPFKVKQVEHNHEVFLFICGVLALTLSGFMIIPGEPTGRHPEIITEAILAP
jgi:predicted cation transporter